MINRSSLSQTLACGWSAGFSLSPPPKGWTPTMRPLFRFTVAMADRQVVRTPLKACLLTRPVREPGLQESARSARTGRPRALTRRFGRVSKQAFGKTESNRNHPNPASISLGKCWQSEPSHVGRYIFEGVRAHDSTPRSTWFRTLHKTSAYNRLFSPCRQTPMIGSPILTTIH